MPTTWHYGLVARDWAEFETDPGEETAYYQRIIERSGEPALDLGCGTGRMLIPYLKAGLDADGVDISADMVAQARIAAGAAGYSPGLYVQPMHQLDLPRRYRTIIARGVIGLGGRHDLTLKALARVREHLRPGGTFAFDYMARWNDPPAWLARLPKFRNGPEEPWPDSSERQRLSDGSELETSTRTLATDPLENVAVRQIRARLWRDGELVEEQVHTQHLDDYTKNELALMLRVAGFDTIDICSDFTDEPATADTHDLVFLARKSG